MAIIIIRTLIIYSALLLTMRLLGKRQLGEMELSEFVLAALIADLAANPLQDIGIPLIYGLLPIAVLFCCELAISGMTVKNIRLRAILFGKPSFLIVKGVIDQKELRRSCFTVDELMQELRNQNCLDISQVEYAILETDGRLNIFPFAEFMPVCAGQLNLPTENDAFPTVIISAGRILEENLKGLGRDMNWLTTELNERGAKSAKSVFLMTLTRSGKIYYAEKENRK